MSGKNEIIKTWLPHVKLNKDQCKDLISTLDNALIGEYDWSQCQFINELQIYAEKMDIKILL